MRNGFQQESEGKQLFQKTDLIIIGGGPAGISAAIWAKRLGLNHILLEARKEVGGQLLTIYNKIIDYPGMISANGPSLKKYMAEHAEKLECSIHTDISAQWIDWNRKIVQTNSGTYLFKALIIATGCSSRRLNVPGEQEMIDRNEVYSATNDREKFNGKKVAVIGGGDRAFEGALLLAEAGASVIVIHRSSTFKARDEFRAPVIAHPSIEIVTDTVVKEIQGSEEKKLTYINAVGSNTITVDGVFIRIGVQPNTEHFVGTLEADQEGYLQCDKSGKTSLPFVYAAGDVCTRPLLSSITSATGQGMIAVKSLSLYLQEYDS